MSSVDALTRRNGPMNSRGVACKYCIISLRLSKRACMYHDLIEELYVSPPPSPRRQVFPPDAPKKAKSPPLSPRELDFQKTPLKPRGLDFEEEAKKLKRSIFKDALHLVPRTKEGKMCKRCLRKGSICFQHKKEAKKEAKKETKKETKKEAKTPEHHATPVQFEAPIAKSTGKPCRRCLRMGSLCFQHSGKKKGAKSGVRAKTKATKLKKALQK